MMGANLQDPYQVVVVYDFIDERLRAWLDDNGWEFFPIPVSDDDLPTFGIRRKEVVHELRRADQDQRDDG